MHELLVIMGVSVLGAVALLILVLLVFVIIWVALTAVRELRKAWRGGE